MAEKLSKNILSGGLAGLLSLTVVYSLDFARTRLANDNKGKGGERQYNGLIDVYTKTLKSDGIQGLYRGFGLSVSLKPMVVGESKNAVLSFFLGWAVTIVSGLMSYPIDTIRRRMMMTSGTGQAYKSAFDCGAHILRNEGFMSMMKGAGANVLRGVAGAGVLAGFDVISDAYIAFRTGK